MADPDREDAGAQPDPVAIVQDHIVQRGGGERVLLAMVRALGRPPVYTTFFRPEETYSEFQGVDVRPLSLNNVGLLREHHRATLPLFPLLVSRIEPHADVVVCGNAGWAQGVRTQGRKIVYFHAMAQWLYRPDHYLRDKGRVARAGLGALRPWLRRWDQRTGRTAHRYFAYGPSMQRRARDAYGVEVEVLRPPVMLADAEPRAVDGIEPGYFLCVTRLVSYKNPDVVVEAFRGLPGKRLVIAGDGPERERLAATAPRNVTLLGNVLDDQLRWLYAHCTALVAAGFEPYGLTPVEAAMFGKGSIALAADGLLDTMVEGETGLLFDAPQPEALRAAVRRFSDDAVSGPALRRLADEHSEARFAERLRSVVDEEAGTQPARG